MSKALSMLITAFFLLVIAAGFLYQQRSINELKRELTHDKNPKVSSEAMQGKLSGSAIADLLGQGSGNPPAKKGVAEAIGSIKEIAGEIIEKEDKFMKVKAPVPDAAKSASADSTDIPTLEKVFVVNFNDSTEFPDSKMADLQVGQKVRVISDQSINKVDTITAVNIIPLSSGAQNPPAPEPGQAVIGGTVEKIEQGKLTISGYDQKSEKKQFIVKIGENTKLIKLIMSLKKGSKNDYEQSQVQIRIEDIKANDYIKVFTVTADSAEVEADSIAVIPLTQ
jgi:hypothetical protein